MKPMPCILDEVQAILEGWKKVARWVVKPQPQRVRPGIWQWEDCQWTDDELSFSANGMEDYAPCQPGDILYVQEEWQEKRGGGYLYKADMVNSLDLFVTPDGRVVGEIPWRSPADMPKEAARLFLRVTDVRAERLHDGFTGPICPLLELEAQGVDAIGQFCQNCKTPCKQCVEHYGEPCPIDSASNNETGIRECHMLDCLRQKFSEIWDRTIKLEDRVLYGWAANPFVWYVVFERISKKEAIGH